MLPIYAELGIEQINGFFYLNGELFSWYDNATCNKLREIVKNSPRVREMIAPALEQLARVGFGEPLHFDVDSGAIYVDVTCLITGVLGAGLCVNHEGVEMSIGGYSGNELGTIEEFTSEDPRYFKTMRKLAKYRALKQTAAELKDVIRAQAAKIKKQAEQITEMELRPGGSEYLAAKARFESATGAKE